MSWKGLSLLWYRPVTDKLRSISGGTTGLWVRILKSALFLAWLGLEGLVATLSDEGPKLYTVILSENKVNCKYLVGKCPAPLLNVLAEAGADWWSRWRFSKEMAAQGIMNPIWKPKFKAAMDQTCFPIYTQSTSMISDSIQHKEKLKPMVSNITSESESETSSIYHDGHWIYKLD